MTGRPSDDGSAAAVTRWWRPLAAALVLTGVVLALYAPAFDGPFVFDDTYSIVQNPAIRSLGNIPGFFTDASNLTVLEGNWDYRPLHVTASALAWAVGNGAAWPFRLLSALLHVAAALLLGATVQILSRRSPETADWTAGERRTAAWVAAALFAVHPLASETVIYVHAQSELIGAVFVLASFAAFAAGAYAPPARRRLLFGVAWLAYGLALLAKPSSVVLPLLLLLWEAVLAPAEPRRVERLRAAVGRQAPFWLLSAGYLGLRHLVTDPDLVTSVGSPHTRFSWIATQLEALYAYYGRLVVWPTDLNVDPEYPLVESVGSVRVLVTILLLALTAVVLWRLWRRDRRQTLFWALWFPAAMALTSFVVILFQVVNEHRAYLPLAGACAFVGVTAQGFARRLPRARRPLTVLGVVVAVSLAAGTAARSRVWKSELSLWEDAAASHGTWRAHMNLGLALEGEGRSDEAMAAFEEAVRQGPYAFAYLNRGLARMRRGRIDEGLVDLQLAQSLWPTSPEVRTYYGLGFLTAGRLAEAERELRAALELRPDSLKALNGLARVLEARQRWDEAASLRGRIARLDPEAAPFHVVGDPPQASDAEKPWAEIARAGVTSVVEGRYDEGAHLLRGVLDRLSPTPDLVFALAFAEQQLGRHAAARQGYEQLLALAPEHVRGTFNLAYELAQAPTGREDLERAVALYRRVRELDPAYDETLFREASALRELGRVEEANRLDAEYIGRPGSHPDLRRSAAERLARGDDAPPGSSRIPEAP